MPVIGQLQSIIRFDFSKKLIRQLFIIKVHVDYWNTDNKREGGARVATFLSYLTDVSVGGKTVFPGIIQLCLSKIEQMLGVSKISYSIKRSLQSQQLLEFETNFNIFFLLKPTHFVVRQLMGGGAKLRNIFLIYIYRTPKIRILRFATKKVNAQSWQPSKCLAKNHDN